jgi:cullin-associated NEDD8-dissociated protein 1
LCGNVRSTGVPEGVTLTSTGQMICDAYTGCGTGTALARWRITILPTITVRSGIWHRPTDPADPDSLWVQGSNGKRFQIASVNHISWTGKYTFINPVASNDLYRPEMLDEFNDMFPVGTTFSFVRPGDPGPPPRTQCALCAPQATLHAQQLLATTPEFHTTAVGTSSATLRPALAAPAATTKAYKAVVFMFLAGGVDSYNVLVPKDHCAEGDMYEEYRNVRTSLALSKTELLTIDAQTKAASSGQVCTQWGLHPTLPTLQRLFNNGDALFVANAGLLITPITKEEYHSRSKPIPSQLFNHGAASKYIQSVDCTTLHRENGVLGRMMDSLDKQGYNTQSYSARGRGAVVLTPETTTREADYKVIHERKGVPQATSDFSALLGEIRDLTSMVSDAAMAETWAGQLNASLDESRSLGDAFKAVTLAQPWSPAESSSLSRQMEMVAKLIKAQATGALTDDRQAFYVRGPNFDSHSGDLLDRMKDVDAAMASFEGEMQAQGMWDSVTVVQSSDFGRSLSSNGDGSDHGWGGNYWVAGGSVRGGQILGTYPNDISAKSELDIGRGRMIPTTGWEQIWHGVAEWFGVAEADMASVLPNLHNFPTAFSKADMFEPTASDMLFG